MSRILMKNTAYFTAASIAQKVIAFVYFALIAKYLGVENTGSYFLATSMIMMLSVLEDIGLNSVIIREIAKMKDSASDWLSAVMGWKLITIPLTLVLVYFLPIWLGYNEEVTSLIRLGSIILVADTLSLSFYGVLRGMRRLRFESIGIFIAQLTIALVGSYFIITGKASVQILILALAAGSIVNMLYSGSIVFQKLGIASIIPRWDMGLKPVRMASAFFLAAIFTKVYSYIDTIVISKVLGETSVGIYAIAYKLTYSFQFLPLAFVAALYPSMSHAAHKPEILKKQLLHSYWYMFLLATPIVFGIWALAEPIVITFSSEEFLDAVPVLRTMIFVLYFIFLDFPIGSLLNATNRQAIKTTIMGISMAVNIVLNLILIPLIGIMGAAIAALVSLGMLFILDWIFSQSTIRIGIDELIREVWGILLAGGVMAGLVSALSTFVHFIILIPVGALIFIGILIITKSVDIRKMKDLLTGKVV